MLKNSDRNCTDALSLIRNNLASEVSRFWKLGPTRMSVCALSRVKGVGDTNAAVVSPESRPLPKGTSHTPTNEKRLGTLSAEICFQLSPNHMSRAVRLSRSFDQF